MTQNETELDNGHPQTEPAVEEELDMDGDETNGLLSFRQADALAHMMAGVPTATIAKEMNIGRSTLQRWKKLPLFKEALTEGQQYLRDNLHHRVSELSSSAIDQIDYVINHADDMLTRANFALRFLSVMNNAFWKRVSSGAHFSNDEVDEVEEEL